MLATLGLCLVLTSELRAEGRLKNLSAEIENSLVSGVNKEHKNIYDDLMISGIYFWNKDVTSSLSFGLVKSFTQKAKTLAKDIVLNLSHRNLYLHAPSDIRLRGYGRLFFPLSRESQKQSQFLVMKSGLGISKNIAALLLGYELSGSYFFHRYTTAKNGTSNKHYGMTNTLTAGYQFSKPLLLNTVWSLLNFATYAGSSKAMYSFVQELSYSFSPITTLSAGLSTGGRQYMNNGEELNLSLFDVKGTELFLRGNILF